MRWSLAILAILTFTQTNGQNQKPEPISEMELQSILSEYNSKAIVLARLVVQTTWNVETDVGNQTKVNEKVLYHLNSKEA